MASLTRGVFGRTDRPGSATVATGRGGLTGARFGGVAVVLGAPDATAGAAVRLVRVGLTGRLDQRASEDAVPVATSINPAATPKGRG